jgi:hypothetical protein
MPLPITVPFTFGNATTTQSLSSLDADFSTVYNAVNGIGNGTVSLANVSITGGSIAANITATGIFSGTSNVSITSTNGPVSINTNGTNAVYIDASQNVGIGTTSPNAVSNYHSLTINATTGGIVYLQNNGTNASQFSGDSGATNIGSLTATPLIFLTNATEKMRIDSSGNLLVGTTTQIGSLGKLGISATSGWAQVVQVANTGTSAILTTNTSGTGLYTAVGFYNNGTTFSACGGITVSGTTTAYGTSSDYRLKDNFVSLTNAIATVKALNPVSYEWKSDGSQGEGFIAHELQGVIPHAVIGEKDAVNEDGSIKPQGVDYSKIVVHLVAAIQELSAKNDALETRLAALEAK